MSTISSFQGFKNIEAFPLIEALLGRRSRRFFLGAEIPDGVFAYKSRHKPWPLTDLEKMLVLSACGGNTSWHHLIPVCASPLQLRRRGGRPDVPVSRWISHQSNIFHR